MKDAEGWEAIQMEPMTDEQIAIGRDLVRHYMNKIMKVVEDFLQLHDNPQQVYLLNSKALNFFMTGQKLFDVSHNPQGNDPGRTANQRIIMGALMPLLMTLAENGSEECAHVIDRIGDRTLEPDHREILRFLATI